VEVFEMSKISLAVISMAVALCLPGNVLAANWTGTVSDNWGVTGNWSTNAVPTLADTVFITTGNAVVYSGTALAKDFTMYTNNPSTTDISLTIKSGAKFLVTPYNLDLGYYGGTHKVIFTVETGADVNVAGYFNTRRPGLTQTNLSGTVNAGNIDISAATKINFTTTGKMIIHANVVANFLDTSSWITEGLITINGVSYGQAGWPGFMAVYDAANKKTTITVATAAAGPDTAVWTGAVSNDWNVAGNWNGGLVPGWNTSVTVPTGTCVVYSGAVQVKDFTAMANGGTGDVHVTVKNGATFNSSWNIDLGYIGGSDTVYFTVEQGASATAGWTFNTRRPGKTYTTVGGTITALGATTETGVDISSATIIDFATTGKLIAKGNMVDIFNDWALPSNNQFRDRGIDATNPGWGTTYGVVAAYAYDQALNTTRLTSIAGPVCDAVYRLPGDENKDCKVDFKDFAVMAKNWMVCAWQPQEACQ
jgi:hypothetical protein